LQIWYQAYTDTSNTAFSRVKSLLHTTLDVTNFDPKFILKVTWKNMLPSYNSLDSEVREDFLQMCNNCVVSEYFP